MDDVFGGLVGTSDVLEDEGSFGQCRVEGVDGDGRLFVLVMDEHHDRYSQVVTVPPESVYLAGNGRMELTLPEDYD